MQKTSKAESVHQVINDLLRHHELLHTVSSDGEHDFVLTDMLTPRGEKSITLGIEEIDHLSECLADAVAPFVSASPDTGEVVAWRYKPALSELGWAYSIEEPVFSVPDHWYWEPLFTHPVTPGGGNETAIRDLIASEMKPLHTIGGDGSPPSYVMVGRKQFEALTARLSNSADQSTQPDLSISGGAQGLEWVGADLFFNKRHIGSVSTWFWGAANNISGWRQILCGVEIDKIAYGPGEKYGDLTTYEKSRTALMSAAKSWLSPLSQASGDAVAWRVEFQDGSIVTYGCFESANKAAINELPHILTVEPLYSAPVLETHRVQHEYDRAMKEASDLATFMWKKFYAEDAPNWVLCDTAAGILSQIDNMVTGLVKAPVSQASDTVAVSREDAEWFAELLTMRLPVLPEPHTEEERQRLNRLRASMGGK